MMHKKLNSICVCLLTGNMIISLEFSIIYTVNLKRTREVKGKEIIPPPLAKPRRWIKDEEAPASLGEERRVS